MCRSKLPDNNNIFDLLIVDFQLILYNHDNIVIYMNYIIIIINSHEKNKNTFHVIYFYFIFRNR